MKYEPIHLLVEELKMRLQFSIAMEQRCFLISIDASERMLLFKRPIKTFRELMKYLKSQCLEKGYCDLQFLNEQAFEKISSIEWVCRGGLDEFKSLTPAFPVLEFAVKE